MQNSMQDIYSLPVSDSSFSFHFPHLYCKVWFYPPLPPSLTLIIRHEKSPSAEKEYKIHKYLITTFKQH